MHAFYYSKHPNINVTLGKKEWTACSYTAGVFWLGLSAPGLSVGHSIQAFTFGVSLIPWDSPWTGLETSPAQLLLCMTHF